MAKTKYSCDNCGVLFEAWPSQRSCQVVFCTYKCKADFQKGKHHGGNTEICEICKKVYYIKPYCVKIGRKCCSWECRRELFKLKTGEKSLRWKGGVYKHTSGYLEQGYVQKKGRAIRMLQHRRVVEEHLGRKLTLKEVVHHINGNKKDNDIENLEVMTRSAHTSLHMAMRYGKD